MKDSEPQGLTDRDLLVDAIREIRQARVDLDQLERSQHAPLAIVGIGCRFPGEANDPESFWALLSGGIDAISDIPSSRWDLDAYYDSRPGIPGKMYVRRGGFVRDVDQFDPYFFDISPREAESLDPQQRLLLEVTWRALEDAGIPPSQLAGGNTGAFVGLGSSDYAALCRREGGANDADTYRILGNAPSVAAGRLGYFFGLHGPVIQLDTACSSSLVAVAQACQALRTGQCDMALAGGVNLMLDPQSTVAVCQLQALSPDGRCKTFDEAANGYVRGEGCGVVVIKRLDDAEAAGDRIWSVIRGVAVNHDGASNGLTAPNGIAQEELLRHAIADARIDPHDVGYLEAHGTGTSLGDPIEVVAASRVLCPQRSADQPLYIGSVKTNLGHLEAAAGIVSLIKACLVVHYGQIPPHLHLQTPNSKIPWRELPIRVPLQKSEWPAARRIAGVSSFGISGTNAHVIIEQPPPTKSDRDPPGGDSPGGDSPCHLLTISCQDARSLADYQGRLHQTLSLAAASEVADICFSSRQSRSHFCLRRALIGASREELLEQLGTSVSHSADEGQARHASRPNVAFLFSGQGSQYPEMGRGLFESQPVFRATLQRCDALLADQLSPGLLQVLWGDTASRARLKETAFTQPAMLSLQLALFELWKSWGIEPDWLIGHSVGEYAAACAAGIFSLHDALRLITKRGELVQSLPAGGAMLAVGASADQTAAAIGDDEIAIASVNAPLQTVVSGSAEAVDRLAVRLAADGITATPLEVSHAFHSHLLDPIMADFRRVAAQVTYHPPRLKLISTTTGKPDDGLMASADYWVDQLRKPVLFLDAMRTLRQQDVAACLELGPGPTLVRLGRACFASSQVEPVEKTDQAAGNGSQTVERQARRKDVVWLPSLSEMTDDRRTMLESLGQLYECGSDVNWKAFDAPFGGQRVALPAYPFQRGSYWIAPSSNGHAAAAAVEEAVAEPALPVPDAVIGDSGSLCDGLEREHQVLTPRLNEIALRFMVQTIKDLGAQWEIGSSFSPDEMSERLPDQHRPKLDRIISHLVNAGWLEQVGGDCWVHVAEPAGSPIAMLDELTRSHPAPEIELVRRSGRKLTQVLLGETEALSLLFPDGSTDEAARFYSEAPLFRRYNELAARVLGKLAAHVGPDRKFSALEIGGGTGGLTAHVLPAVETAWSNYTFTDVSPFFLSAASRRFAKHEFFETALLDISQDPTEQGLHPGSYDVVFAANVLHATRDLRSTLKHVNQLLKPGGWLVLLEGTTPPLWGDMVFALIDGWWLFEDRDLRPDYPLMPASRWQHLLKETGFSSVMGLGDSAVGDASIHTLFLAQSSDRAGAASPLGNGAKTVATAAKANAKASLIRAAVAREAMAGLEGPEAPEDSSLQGEFEALVADIAGRVLHMPVARLNLDRSLLDQGMDSLMLIELRTIVERELAIELPMRLLTSSPTVVAIATHLHGELSLDEIGSRDSKVRATAVGDERAAGRPGQVQRTQLRTEPAGHIGSRILVRLQPEGDETPLFFVPAGYGDLLAFQDVAKMLGFEHPVYGLQPPGAKHVKAIRHMSIYRLISTYIAEIKKVQPNGPYRLTGYSAGAIIAVELARELVRKGDQVEMLVVLDPPIRVPRWLDNFYTLAYRFCEGTHLLALVRRFRWRPLRRLFHAVLDEGLRTHTAVTAGHVTAPFPGRITYFRATKSWVPMLSFWRTRRFWRRVAQEGAELHYVPGSHYGMLRGSNGEALAEELKDCLKRS